MFKETLREKHGAILKEIIPILIAKKYYLAGGPGLTLQIGHKFSEDFDFITEVSFKPHSLYSFLKSKTDSWKKVKYFLLEILRNLKDIFSIKRGIWYATGY